MINTVVPGTNISVVGGGGPNATINLDPDVPSDFPAGLSGQEPAVSVTNETSRTYVNMGWVNRWARHPNNPLLMPQLNEDEVERIVENWLGNNIQDILGEVLAALTHFGPTPPTEAPLGKPWLDETDGCLYIMGRHHWIGV